MKPIFLYFLLFLCSWDAAAQNIQWRNVDTAFGPLPKGVHLYETKAAADSSPFRAFYLEVPLTKKSLQFTTDTTKGRRLTPSQFWERLHRPLVVVNATFFSFANNANLNAVVQDGKLLAYNVHSLPGRGRDTLTYLHPFGSAIGISKKRKADIAWLATDTASAYPFASQYPIKPVRDSFPDPGIGKMQEYTLSRRNDKNNTALRPWPMRTAIGGGPVLVQEGRMRITNDEEIKFTGKAINDKHPRTAMGYTKDGRLIILAVEGRNPRAAGASLVQLAEIMISLGCEEALNLDGGGSSCLLVNGKETITVSDKTGQRPIPGVFVIRGK